MSIDMLFFRMSQTDINRDMWLNKRNVIRHNSQSKLEYEARLLMRDVGNTNHWQYGSYNNNRWLRNFSLKDLKVNYKSNIIEPMMEKNI